MSILLQFAYKSFTDFVPRKREVQGAAIIRRYAYIHMLKTRVSWCCRENFVWTKSLILPWPNSLNWNTNIDWLLAHIGWSNRFPSQVWVVQFHFETLKDARKMDSIFRAYAESGISLGRQTQQSGGGMFSRVLDYYIIRSPIRALRPIRNCSRRSCSEDGGGAKDPIY